MPLVDWAGNLCLPPRSTSRLTLLVTPVGRCNISQQPPPRGRDTPPFPVRLQAEVFVPRGTTLSGPIPNCFAANAALSRGGFSLYTPL
ncbi:MAG: hypothetical protein JWO59_2288 [Chloroflexi bacterium]|nr:hypothetical protein [Chloroflexota bacterium]